MSHDRLVRMNCVGPGFLENGARVAFWIWSWLKPDIKLGLISLAPRSLEYQKHIHFFIARLFLVSDFLPTTLRSKCETLILTMLSETNPNTHHVGVKL